MLSLIRDFFKLAFAFLLLFYLFISRFIKINTFKEFKNSENIFNLIFTECLTLLFIFLLCITIYNMINKNKRVESIVLTKIKNTFGEIINKYYYAPLSNIDKYFNTFLNQQVNIDRSIMTDKLLVLLYRNLKQNSNINKIIMVYLLLKYIPKVVVSLIFFIDASYFQKIMYFYWVLPLLLIPLILQYLMYITLEYYYTSISILANNIEIHDIIPSTPENLLPLIMLNDYLNKSIHYQLYDIKNPYEFCLSLEYFKKLSKEENKKPFDYETPKKYYGAILSSIEGIYLIKAFFDNLDKKYNSWFNLIIFGFYAFGWGFFFINILFMLFPEYFALMPEKTNPFI